MKECMKCMSILKKNKMSTDVPISVHIYSSIPSPTLPGGTNLTSQ